MGQTHTDQLSKLPLDTNAALLEVTHTIKNLGGVYVEETEALNNIDNKRFLELQAKKLIAAREYQNDMGQMLERKDEINKSSSASKNILKEVHEEFQEISRKNMEALERMQKCTEKLGNTLRSAAIRDAHKLNGYSYGDNGAIPNAASKKVVSSGLSETV